MTEHLKLYCFQYHITECIFNSTGRGKNDSIGIELILTRLKCSIVALILLLKIILT
jgi:hypothetical protein